MGDAFKEDIRYQISCDRDPTLLFPTVDCVVKFFFLGNRPLIEKNYRLRQVESCAFIIASRVDAISVLVPLSHRLDFRQLCALSPRIYHPEKIQIPNESQSRRQMGTLPLEQRNLPCAL